MNRRLLTLVAVALPVAGTLGSIAVNEWSLRGATEWRIPIEGYDPRDPLRGRYIVFNYVWNVHGNVALCSSRDSCQLCLEAGGRDVLVTPIGQRCAAPIDPTASGLPLPRFADVRTGVIRAPARLWISEARAPLLERQLRAGPMIAVARLTRGGRLMAERLEPAE